MPGLHPSLIFLLSLGLAVSLNGQDAGFRNGRSLSSSARSNIAPGAFPPPSQASLSSSPGYSSSGSSEPSPSAAQDANSSSGPGSAASMVAYTNSMEVLDDKRTLGPGDRVSFRVVEDRKDPVSLAVTDSGEMEVPLIGRVPAANKTCKQLAYAVKGPLERTYFYKATVIVGLDVASVRSKGRVYVTGQVRNQGAIDIPWDETFTLSKAVLRAGGLADFANKKKVRLVRKVSGSSPETTVVNLEEIMDKGMVDRDPVLKPDDTIIVPQRLVNF